ncbi:MAG TPA: histidinol dehydrogenase, partial [Verrucomicrobiota bacterium]|nr:histidinol dehydrogenase [Verrucomicrobiota bacterium]
MRLVRSSDSDFSAQIERGAAASSLFDPVIEERTREIVTAVRERGDGALIEFTQRFDQASLSPTQIPVTTAERMDAAVRADAALRDAVAFAHENIAAFARRSLRCGWQTKNAQ